MDLLLALVLIAGLAWFVSVPLRAGADRAAAAEAATEDPRLAELEARKEALYRQIRDAELDRAQGKMSEEDWRRADAELRRDAIDVLKEIDRAGGGVSGT